MKLKTIFHILLISTLIYSCKKDENIIDLNPVNPASPSANFGQLKVGNYWVYERFDVDSSGVSTTLNIFDSCYIEKDTVINSKTYYKFIKPPFNSVAQREVLFQRDSLHYIVNSVGKIIFSSQDFTTIFDTKYFFGMPGDTICQMIKKMADKDVAVSTPSGTYLTSNAKEVYYMYPSWTLAGNQRNKHLRYAENIGIVTETFPFFVSVPNYTEKRLIRYHLN